MHFLEARLSTGTVRLPLADGTTTVGRGQECDVVLDDPSISRKHLTLTRGQDNVTLEDLDSTNGVWIGGNRIERASIRPEQWFVAGTVLMTVRDAVSVSCGSSDPDAPVDASITLDGVPPQHDTPAPGHDVDTGDVATLTACLRAPAGDEGSLDLLIDWILRVAEASTLVALEGADPAPVVRIARGNPRDVVDDPDILTTAVDGPSVFAAGTTPVLVVPVGDTAAGPLCIVLAPWGSGENPGAVLELGCRCLGMALERCADPPATAAPVDGDVPESPTFDDPASDAATTFIAASDAAREVLRTVDRFAATTLPVLVRGDSGTGKELLAHRIHDRSSRHAGPFVAINCASLPKDLLEAELFGIEKGVATGVDRRAGKFQIASGGTLFLDEVGDLPLALQPKLLRALESNEVTPLGAARPAPVDVRIVSATHRSLRDEADADRFRRDLFFRLAGAEVEVPPLADRPEDILPLARAFAREGARRQRRRFHGFELGAAQSLVGYAWPGNVRELRHVVLRALALADGPILHEGLLPAEILERTDRAVGDLMLAIRGDWRAAKTAFERVYFARLLARSGSNLSEASRRAGLSRSNLYRHLDDLGLRNGDDES